MSKLKKTIWLANLWLFPGLVNAQVVITSPLRSTSFQEMVTRIGNWIFTLAIGILPIMILIGAYMLVTGGGDPKKAALGRKIILYAIIGFIIIAVARGILALLRVVLGI
ncbi:hypothetical protein J7J24_01590 [bacterium]|nr:hypothetical protein [bacterium]